MAEQLTFIQLLCHPLLRPREDAMGELLISVEVVKLQLLGCPALGALSAVLGYRVCSSLVIPVTLVVALA